MPTPPATRTKLCARRACRSAGMPNAPGAAAAVLAPPNDAGTAEAASTDGSPSASLLASRASSLWRCSSEPDLAREASGTLYQRTPHGRPRESRKICCNRRKSSKAASISSRKPETDSTEIPRGTPQSPARVRIVRRISVQIATDSPTAASLETSTFERIRDSTSGGTLMPSQRTNCSVLGRPTGANVRRIFLGASPRLRHSAP
mmetsp:Transcript_28244/g.72314  ORF Transcript_28244/g.72314 Transcript_28244/m.72314 type:complete len:204 (+) Transcript_28244:283-894(+)